MQIIGKFVKTLEHCEVYLKHDKNLVHFDLKLHIKTLLG